MGVAFNSRGNGSARAQTWSPEILKTTICRGGGGRPKEGSRNRRRGEFGVRTVTEGNRKNHNNTGRTEREDLQHKIHEEGEDTA